MFAYYENFIILMKKLNRISKQIFRQQKKISKIINFESIAINES